MGIFLSLAKYWAEADLITEITKIAAQEKTHLQLWRREAAAGANAPSG